MHTLYKEARNWKLVLISGRNSLRLKTCKTKLLLLIDWSLSYPQSFVFVVFNFMVESFSCSCKSTEQQIIFDEIVQSLTGCRHFDKGENSRGTGPTDIE